MSAFYETHRSAFKIKIRDQLLLPRSLNESDAEEMKNRNNNSVNMPTGVKEPERRNSASKAQSKQQQMTLSEYNRAQAEKRALRCNIMD